ncbi:hypothetical protein C8R44DRAFT_822441 [Mycena epipterygia]|nr:hypothetical protein C8R44DRAFT_822441 [Mycena epipterygia]
MVFLTASKKFSSVPLICSAARKIACKSHIVYQNTDIVWYTTRIFLSFSWRSNSCLIMTEKTDSATMIAGMYFVTESRITTTSFAGASTAITLSFTTLHVSLATTSSRTVCALVKFWMPTAIRDPTLAATLALSICPVARGLCPPGWAPRAPGCSCPRLECGRPLCRG